MSDLPSRRAIFPPFAATLAGLAVPQLLQAQPKIVEPPITGSEHAKLAGLDQFMLNFVKEQQVPGAALAVTRGGKLEYARGFGFANVDKKLPVQPDSLFRIASVSKPITATAILQLVEKKHFKLDDKVVDLMGLKAVVAPGTTRDPRWKQVTVRHCLHHTGGWDRDKSYDPISRPGVIAKAVGKGPPVPPEDIVRYMMGQPLDFDPGERVAYSNLGYLILGRIIAHASGMTYEQYVKKEVFGKIGVKRAQLGRALVEKRARGEVLYYDRKMRTGPCLYPPRQNETVLLPDGVENFEGFEAHGGWIASAIDLAKFAAAFDKPEASPLLSAKSLAEFSSRPTGAAGTTKTGEPLSVFMGCGWSVRVVDRRGTVNLWHSGYIGGTEALLVRRFDGMNWVVLFNTHDNPKGKSLVGLIDPLIHETLDSVKEWPGRDLFGNYLK